MTTNFDAALADLSALPADEVALAAKVEVFFRAFVKKADEDRKAYMLKSYANLDPGFLSVDETGRRFWRVVKNDGASRSVYCFVEKATGDIYKAESWKKPAKHARGNVMATDGGSSAVTPWGAVYFR